MTGEVDPTAADPLVKAVSTALQAVARLHAAGASRGPLCRAVALGLETLVPGAVVSVVDFDPIQPSGEVLATSGPGTLMFSVDRIRQPGSFIGDCARRPVTVLSIGGAAASGQFRMGGGSLRGVSTIVGMSVPIGNSATWVLLMAIPAVEPSDQVKESLRVFGSVLRSIFKVGGSDPSAEVAGDPIERAKLEWELTADALPQVVCLLDASGRVMRSNRTIERWSLGRVEDARGRHFHELLHGPCQESNCRLHSGVVTAFRRMQEDRHRAYEFELDDKRLGRFIKVRLARMLGPRGDACGSAMACAVLVVHDITAIERAKRELASLNAELERRVSDRTAELEQANRELQAEIAQRFAVEEQLRHKSAELAALSEGLIDTQEQERKRISRELHDSVGQSLSALKYGLERAAELERQGRLAGTFEVLQKSVENVQTTMDDVRNIALDLRPTILDDLGAASAVNWFCRTFAASYPDLDVVVDVTARDSEVPERLATTIFRSLQELLNNVSRHARASKVRVSLRVEAGRVMLEVVDDGIGLKDPAPARDPRHGHGTRNLRERAELTGGHFELTSGSPRGAVARIYWFLSPDGMAVAPGTDEQGADS